jgi:hypothetical protein
MSNFNSIPKFYPSDSTVKGNFFRLPFSYSHGIIEDLSGTDIILCNIDPINFDVGIEAVEFVSNTGLTFSSLLFTKFKEGRNKSLLVATIDSEAIHYAYEWYIMNGIL